MEKTLKKHYILILHLSFWSIIYVPIYLSLINKDSSLLIAKIITHLYILSVFYLNYFLLIPRFLNRKHYFSYCISYITSIAVFLIFMLAIRQNFIPPETSSIIENYITNFMRYVDNILLYSVVAIFARSYVDWQKNTRELYELQIEKRKNDISILKNQLNPHFYFNNLNNLYSLCLEKDDNAAPMVSTLSDLTRTYLNHSLLNKISIKKEMEFCKTFVDFQLLKKPKSNNVDIYSEGKLEQFQIVPMILINYVENAFKHSNIFHDKNAQIEISCSVIDNTLTYIVRNTIYKLSNSSVSGLGNINISKILELSYKDRYSLKTEKLDGYYNVTLTIKDS